MVEIYGLYDPQTDELRYVGKAKNAAKRLDSHLRESRNLARPVHCWVKKVLESGGIPRLRILEIVPDDQWEEAERRLIAKYRVTGQLLNLADGGAIPSQTKEQRRSAARASNMAQQAKGKEWAEFVRSKRDLARLLSVYMRQKAFTDAYLLRFDMRLRAADKPHLYGSWANL